MCERFVGQGVCRSKWIGWLAVGLETFQFDANSRTHFDLAGDFDLPAVLLDNPFTDGHAQPGSSRFGRVKGLEHPVNLSLRHATPSV